MTAALAVRQLAQVVDDIDLSLELTRFARLMAGLYKGES